MACKYIIKINDGSGRVLSEHPLPSTLNSEYDFSIERLINDFSTEFNKERLKSIVLEAKDVLDSIYEEQRTNPNLVIPQINIGDAMYKIQKNLAMLGVNVRTDANMDKLFGEGVQSAVSNGVVYVRKNAPVTAPIHELLHLAFGVLRATESTKFVDIMNTVLENKEVQKEIQSLQEVPEYQNMIQSDITEEAFVRVIEKLLNNELDADQTVLRINGNDISLWDFINYNLSKPLAQTFGIENIPNVVDFLKSKISDLPLQGSNLFVKQKIKSNGYSKLKQKAILGAKIVNFLKDKVKDGIIKEGDCQ